MAGSIGTKGMLLAAVSLALSGCVSLGNKTPKVLLSLTAQNTAPVGEQTEGKLSDAIVVLDPSTDRRLDVLRVPVQVNASSIAYLKDVSWVEKPARAFRGLLAETIRANGGPMVIEGGDFEARSKTMLSGRLLDMGYDAPSQSVVVRFDAIRHDREGETVTKRFEATVPGIQPKAQFVGPALNEAANEVAQAVAKWVVE